MTNKDDKNMKKLTSAEKAAIKAKKKEEKLKLKEQAKAAKKQENLEYEAQRKTSLEAEDIAIAQEQKEKERDDKVTKLCYDRALQAYYERNGLSADEEKKKKEAAAARIKKLDEMSLWSEIVYKTKERHRSFKDPLKGKIMRAKILSTLGAILRALVLFGLCFIIFLPFIEKVSYAIRSPLDISNPQVIWIPAKISSINLHLSWILLTKDGNSFVNTLLLSSIIAFLQVISTAVAGYAFARLKFKGANIIFAVVLLSLAIPNEAMNVSRALFFKFHSFFGIELMENVLAIYIMTIFGQGLRSAIFIYLFRQTFRGLPVELEESAEIDGAGVVRTFWSVMLPNARGTIVTVALFAFVWQYNDYYYAKLFNYARTSPLLTTSLAGSTENIGAAIYTNFPKIKQQFGDVIGSEFYELISQTEALLMMLPLLIGYIFVQRMFVESVERSGITGM